MATMNFGGVEETVVTRQEFSLEQARQVLQQQTIAVIGYGAQGPAQACNLRDNGFKVIVGQRKNSATWQKAIDDGWQPDETLFEIEAAAEKGTIIAYLLSDAAQIELWPTVKPHLTKGKTLYFSHGFGITFAKQTGIKPPAEIDVVMVAPKGTGRTLRKIFLDGRGVNSSYAVAQDASGQAERTAQAMGIGVGSGFLFKTSFEKEVYSDLTGERGVLMGAIAGLMEAQYNLFRKHGHSPSEAFNETVEEATQSLIPLIGENGMEWMFANCSTTAQRGALDWKGKFRQATEPVFAELYDSVRSGKEAERTISKNSQPNYRQELQKELDEMHASEMWQTGQTVRSLRPENQ